MTRATSFPEMVCPVDQTALSSDAGGDVLACREGHRFPIRRGIPRLLAPGRNYAEAFGAQWHHYRVTQLDSYTKTTLSRDRLRRCIGEVSWSELESPQRLFQVLEAGCGAGRFTEVLLQLPGASVTSTDLSSAVEPNQANCPQSDRHRIMQCDIGRFPFRPGQFDFVICLGVIQHTESPENTISKLYEQVKPGGWLIIDHYEHSLSHHTRFGDLVLRPILKRLAPQRGLAATRALTRLFFPLHRAVRRVRVAQMLLSRISPVLTYYQAFPQLDDRLQYEWAELDTHDGLTDWYKHLRTPRVLRAALVSLGASDVWVAAGGNGIEARCRKPL